MVNCKSEMVDLEKKDSIALDFGYKYGYKEFVGA